MSLVRVQGHESSIISMYDISKHHEVKTKPTPVFLLAEQF